MAHEITLSDVVVAIDSGSGKPIISEHSFPMASNKEVAGFGKFIKYDAAVTMCKEYVKANEELFTALGIVKDELGKAGINPALGSGKLSDVLDKSLQRLKPENDIIAGTYGKELLLTLLSRPGCEGLRFVFCEYNGEKSMYFYPVDASGTNPLIKEYVLEKFKGTKPEDLPPTDPGGEVKEDGTKRQDFNETLEKIERGDNPLELGITPEKANAILKENFANFLFLMSDKRANSI